MNHANERNITLNTQFVRVLHSKKRIIVGQSWLSAILGLPTVYVCVCVCVCAWVYSGYIMHHYNGIWGPCAPSGAICTTKTQCAPWCTRETIFFEKFVQWARVKIQSFSTSAFCVKEYPHSINDFLLECFDKVVASTLRQSEILWRDQTERK